MGLVKLALIGGAAYYAGKKFNESHNNNGYPNQTDNNWGHGWGGRCQRKRQQQQQQQQQQSSTMIRDVDDGNNNNVYSDYPSEKKQQPITTATEQQQYDYPPYSQGPSPPAQPGYYWYGPSPHSHPVNGYTATTRDQKTPPPLSSTGREMVKIEAATTPSPVDNDAVPVNAAHLPPYSTSNGAPRGLSPRRRMYPYPHEKESMI